jgi:mannosyl-3-phosphoglycerate phosphatase
MSSRVVFSDIDGTLIDIFTGQFNTTVKFVDQLREYGIPLVLCSSKTEAEQIELRRMANVSDPFIVENGGAVFIPLGYFENMSNYESKYSVIETDNFQIIELGKPASQIKSALQKIRASSQFKFKSLSDLSIDEISIVTKMSTDAVSRMIQRKYGETIVEIKNDDLPGFVTKVQDFGLKVIFGGRFFDITGGNDKGTAVKILVDLYRRKYGGDVVFFGIGDSKNDESMLKFVDFPMLVQRPDGTWYDMKVDGLNKLNGIGPDGWILGFNEIINYLKK